MHAQRVCAVDGAETSKQHMRDGGAEEAYATIVANDGAHACSAVVLGRILQRLDPPRRRAVLVHKTSTATRAMLQRDGLWEIVTMPDPFDLPQSVLPWFKPLQALQAQLWSLPFRRVLYFDTDHLPLPGPSPHRLLGLWSSADRALLAAPSEGPLERGCFNSGMMMLRPSPSTLDQLREAAKHLARRESRPELLALRGRCPNGWNLDQPLINHVFPRGKWDRLYSGARNHETLWRMATTFHVLHGGGPKLCEAPSTNSWAEVADSFHYMQPFRPWEHARSSCAIFGVGCLRQSDLERFEKEAHFKNASAAFEPWLNCSLWDAAASRWWVEFVQLNARTRSTCMKRIWKRRPGERSLML